MRPAKRGVGIGRTSERSGTSPRWASGVTGVPSTDSLMRCPYIVASAVPTGYAMRSIVILSA